MGENKQVESEKQRVSEDQDSKEQEGNNDKDKGGFFSLCPSI